MTQSASFTAWKPLPSSSAGRQINLYRLCFGEKDYEVQVTDLCDLWTEKLAESAIIGRAYQTNCSIDPGQDTSQFGNLLRHVNKALQGISGTRVKGPRQVTESSVRLELRSELPHGIRNFDWHLKLSLRGKEEMRDCVLYPLALISCLQDTRLLAITNHLKEKDVAISKLLDKVEGTGVDAGLLLPAAVSGRSTKNTTVKDLLLRHVPGLRPFDDHILTQSHHSLEGGHLSTRDLKSAFAGTAFDKAGLRDSESVSLATDSAARMPNIDRKPSAGSDDEFQQQRTPPHLRHAAGGRLPSEQPPTGSVHQHAMMKMGSDEETTDDDLDVIAGTSNDVSSRPSRTDTTLPMDQSRRINETIKSTESLSKAQSPAKRLGSFRSKKQRTPSPKPDEAVELSNVTDDAIRTELSIIKEPSTPIASRTGESKVKGKIGSKRNIPIALATREATGTSSTQQPPPSANFSSRIQNNQRHNHDKPTEAEVFLASNEPLNLPEATPSPRETPQDRAEQKRKQLKEQLEVQSRAQAKKKRRF